MMTTEQDAPAKKYLIRRQDYFEAIATDQLSDQHILAHQGSIWIELYMTPAQRAVYMFPIWEFGTCIISK